MKKEIQVKIKLTDKTKEADYTVFLNQFSRYRKGEEKIEELLESDKVFIPVKSITDSNFELINLNNIVYLIEQQKKDVIPLAEKKYNLYLSINSTLKIEHFIDLPEFRSRLQDYMNTDQKFLQFLHKGKIIHVNKKKIVRIK